MFEELDVTCNFQDLFSRILRLFSPSHSAALYFYLLLSVSISLLFLFVPVSISPSQSIVNDARQWDSEELWKDSCQRTAEFLLRFVILGPFPTS